MDYYGDEKNEVLRFIPPDANIVVEISCSNSTLEKQYRRINPSCKYIHLNFTMQEISENDPQLSSVILNDIKEMNRYENNIDCLVYAKLLLNEVQPFPFLRQYAAKLKIGGQVIASICENKYSRLAMVDSIRNLFHQAGLTIFEIHGNDDCFIVRAVKGFTSVSRLLIQSLLGETKVCARVRIIEPHNFLATIPGVYTKSEVKVVHLDRMHPNENKIFIWQRVLINDIAGQQELMRRGFLTLAEFDDDPLRWPEHAKNKFLIFRSCHGIQVSTEPLAKFLRQYNPNVAVFPNQLAYLPGPRAFEDSHEKLTVFFGALNRELDWAPILSRLNRVLHRYKDRIKVVVIHDRKLFEAVDTPDKYYSPFCSYRDYESALHSADIALLPLQPNRFNSMKSDLKFLECAAHGVVVLASPTVYAQSVIDGETGMIYHTPAEFEEKLLYLIEDRRLRLSISKSAYGWVAQHRMLCRHYRDRYNWYRTMLDCLPELNHSVEKRVSEFIF